MDFNSNLNNLFQNYQQQQKYAKKKFDANKDGKINNKDKTYLANKETNLLKKSNIFDFNNDGVTDINDLFIISSERGIDFNNDGEYSDLEKAFLSDYKTKISNKIVENIVNKKLTLNDLLEFDDKLVQNMSYSDRTFWKAQITSMENKIFENIKKIYDLTGDKKINMNDLKEFWKSSYTLMNSSTKLSNGKTLKDMVSQIEKEIIKQVKRSNKNITDAKIKTAKNNAVKELKAYDGMYKAEAEAKAKTEAEEKARLEAEEKARLEAEEKARLEAEEAEKFKFKLDNGILFNNGEKYSGLVQKDVTSTGFAPIYKVKETYTITNSDGTKSEVVRTYDSREKVNSSETLLYENGRVATGETYVKETDTYYKNGKILSGYTNDGKICKDGKALNGYYSVTEYNDGSVNFVQKQNFDGLSLYVNGEIYNGEVEISTNGAYIPQLTIKVKDENGNVISQSSNLYSASISFPKNSTGNYQIANGKIADNVYVEKDGKQLMFVKGQIADKITVKIDGKDLMFVDGQIADNGVQVGDRFYYGGIGYDAEGFDAEGYNKDGYNKDGFNKLGFDKDGYNVQGFDKDGYDKDGYNAQGLNAQVLHKDGFDEKTQTMWVNHQKLTGFADDGKLYLNGKAATGFYSPTNEDNTEFVSDFTGGKLYINGELFSGDATIHSKPASYDSSWISIEKDGKKVIEFSYNEDLGNSAAYPGTFENGKFYLLNGYGLDGYDRDGFNRKGFDKDGFNRRGLNNLGFDKAGNDVMGNLRSALTDIENFSSDGWYGKVLMEDDKAILEQYKKALEETITSDKTAEELTKLTEEWNQTKAEMEPHLQEANGIMTDAQRTAKSQEIKSKANEAITSANSLLSEYAKDITAQDKAALNTQIQNLTVAINSNRNMNELERLTNALLGTITDVTERAKPTHDMRLESEAKAEADATIERLKEQSSTHTDRRQKDKDGNLLNGLVGDTYYNNGIPGFGVDENGNEYDFYGKIRNVSYADNTPVEPEEVTYTKVKSEYSGFGDVENMTFRNVTVPNNLIDSGYMTETDYVLFDSKKINIEGIETEKTWEFIAIDGSYTKTIMQYLDNLGNVVQTIIEDNYYQKDFVTESQTSVFDGNGNCVGRYLTAQEVSEDGETLRTRSMEDIDGTGINITEIENTSVPMAFRVVTNVDPNKEYEAKMNLASSLSEIANIHFTTNIDMSSDFGSASYVNIITNIIRPIVDDILIYDSSSGPTNLKYDVNNNIVEFDNLSVHYELKYDTNNNLAKIIYKTAGIFGNGEIYLLRGEDGYVNGIECECSVNNKKII